jgi:2-keto-4-pentenoate hydratase
MTPASQVAAELLRAEQSGVPISPLRLTHGVSTAEQAYDIQFATLQLKRDQGRRVVGWKIGLTNPVMQRTFGISEPDYGVLLDNMAVTPGGAVPAAALIAPRVEPELAFRVRQDVGSHPISLSNIDDYLDGVWLALEIVDSRIAEWDIQLADTIADNASSGRFVLGDALLPLARVDMLHTAVDLLINGHVVGSGISHQVMGSPLAAVVWLLQKLQHHGVSVQKGEVLLSGAICNAVPVQIGDTVVGKFAGLGEVGCTLT